jgi:hypothetical protein
MFFLCNFTLCSVTFSPSPFIVLVVELKEYLHMHESMKVVCLMHCGS